MQHTADDMEDEGDYNTPKIRPRKPGLDPITTSKNTFFLEIFNEQSPTMPRMPNMANFPAMPPLTKQSDSFKELNLGQRTSSYHYPLMSNQSSFCAQNQNRFDSDFEIIEVPPQPSNP